MSFPNRHLCNVHTRHRRIDVQYIINSLRRERLFLFEMRTYFIPIRILKSSQLLVEITNNYIEILQEKHYISNFDVGTCFNFIFITLLRSYIIEKKKTMFVDKRTLKYL